MITPEHVTTSASIVRDSTLVHSVPDQGVRVEEGTLAGLTHVRSVILRLYLFHSVDAQSLGQLIIVPHQELSLTRDITRHLVEYPIAQLKGYQVLLGSVPCSVHKSHPMVSRS